MFKFHNSSPKLSARLSFIKVVHEVVSEPSTDLRRFLYQQQGHSERVFFVEFSHYIHAMRSTANSISKC